MVLCSSFLALGPRGRAGQRKACFPSVPLLLGVWAGTELKLAAQSTSLPLTPGLLFPWCPHSSFEEVVVVVGVAHIV